MASPKLCGPLSEMMNEFIEEQEAKGGTHGQPVLRVQKEKAPTLILGGEEKKAQRPRYQPAVCRRRAEEEEAVSSPVGDRKPSVTVSEITSDLPHVDEVVRGTPETTSENIATPEPPVSLDDCAAITAQEEPPPLCHATPQIHDARVTPASDPLPSDRAQKRLIFFRKTIEHQLCDSALEFQNIARPLLEYRVAESLLWSICKESEQVQKPFRDLVERKEVQERFAEMSVIIERDGDHGAESLLEDHYAQQLHGGATELMNKSVKTAIDEQTLHSAAIALASKARRDGLEEWQSKHFREALVCFRDGDALLSRIQGPSRQDRAWDGKLEEERVTLQLALLKNLAQAAMKLELWDEALNAANNALCLDQKDHKAWFRKASALEGRGDFDKVEFCLRRVEELISGHADRERVLADVDAKRAKLRSVREAEQSTCKNMFQIGLAKGAFRDEARTQESERAAARVAEEAAKKEAARVAEEAMKFADEAALTEEAWRGWLRFEILGEVIPMQLPNSWGEDMEATCGQYFALRQLRATEACEVSSDKLGGVIRQGAIVDVVEVLELPANKEQGIGALLRGRIDSPIEGWITMRSQRGARLVAAHSTVTPADVTRVWESDWGLAYTSRIKFEAPAGSKSKWLNPRTDALPGYPATTRLIANEGILRSVLLELSSRAGGLGSGLA